MDNLEGAEIFNQEEIESLNKPINKIRRFKIRKKKNPKNIPGPDSFMGEFYQT